MRIPPAFTPPNLQHPSMAQTRAGLFTPAIAAWSSPTGLSGLGALGVPNWMGYLLAGGLLWLSYRRKIPWWAGVAGAGVAWWWLGGQGNMAQTISTGRAVAQSGTVYQLTPNSPGTLVTTPNGITSITIAGVVYPVLTTEQNQDGSTSYYLDNPTPTAA
jgi:hypothetical protein